MDPWCTPTFTSNSSDNYTPAMTLVFAPSYKLITALTITSGIPFFLIAHSTTFLGTLSNAFQVFDNLTGNGNDNGNDSCSGILSGIVVVMM